MEFASAWKLNCFLRIRAKNDNDFIEIKITLFSCIKFSLYLLKHKKLSRKKIIKFIPKYKEAVVVFDHQWGGGGAIIT